MKALISLFITIFIPCTTYGGILSHYLKVEIDPVNHTIDAVDMVTVQEPDGAIEFTINKNLRLKSIKSDGKDLRYEVSQNNDKKVIKVYCEGKTKIDFSYSGIIYDEIKGERGITFLRGGITKGLISERGVFLSSDSGWYPDIENSLSVFDIDVRIKGELKVITQGDLVKREYKDQYEYTEWRGSVPVDGLVLVASRYEVKTEEINGIRYSTYLSEENSHLSDIFIKGSNKYIDFYSKILGRYPYKHWSVVENFFSSGYGMPGFTLLDPLVIKQGERILKPGYIDHEIVHCWFGNYVYPDYRKGNWAEAITTYLTNYYYKEAVLGGEEAKRHRINTIEKFSIKVSPEKDYPLRGFVSKEEDFENEIGYGKGSMVFHELRRLMGDDSFFNTLKSIVINFGGRRTSWDDFRSEFEKGYSRSLSFFFDQWLDRVQGPRLRLKDVTLETKEKGFLIKGSVLQEGDIYNLNIPIVVFEEKGREEFFLKIEEREKGFSFVVSKKPLSIEIDPDYHIFRIVPEKDLHPCLNLFLEQRNKYYLISGNDTERRLFLPLAERLKGEKGGDVISHNNLIDAMKKGSILILGKVDLKKPIRGLTIGDRDFIFKGKTYDKADQALLYSFRNPYNEEEIITIYFGNSPDAILRARYIPYYGSDTYIIFEGGQPIERGYLERDRTETKFIFGKLDRTADYRRSYIMEKVKVWYDPEGDYLEGIFEKKEGYFKETESDQIMEKVDMDGKVIGFSILKVSSLKDHPIEVSLAGKKS